MQSSCLLLLCLLLVFSIGEGQIRFPSRGSGQRLPRPKTPRPVPPKENGKSVGCNCLQRNSCPSGFGQLRTSCVAEGGRDGICCIPQEGVILTRVGLNDAGPPVSVSPNSVQSGFNVGQRFFSDLEQQEKRRLRNREFLNRGDPARGHAFFFTRRPSTVKIHDLAYIIGKSSQDVAQSESLTPQQSVNSLPAVQVRSNQRPFECPMEDVPRCDPGAKYRTIDGTCNNLRKPLLGRSETAFGRITPALYEDGIMTPRETGVDGQPLPNVRIASNTILLDVDIPATEFTLGVMQWAQFMDHDLTHAPFPDMDGEAIRCCENGQLVSPMPELCFPITISPDDGFFGPRNQRCINFVRSMLALQKNCALGPVEQLNALTHWVDGSMIYGSTEEEEERVVDTSTGFMKTSANNLPPLNRTIECDANDGATCLAGGDSRINEQPALTVMHTLWIREHNRIANILKQAHRDWNAQTLFEETRRIVIAEVQHITYNEWLPIIIGQDLVNRLNINSLRSGFRNSYDPSADPVMFNEFATAAFRFGHSMVQGLFRLFSNTGRSSSMRLRNVFNSPGLLQKNPSLVDSFVNSLTIQNIQNLDNFITKDLSNHLFQTPRVDFGMDLMSLNLQRGREHAIATYKQMRERFNVGSLNNFLDLLTTTSDKLVQRMQTVYRNVEDIDLFVGGMTEKSRPGAMLGPTFANIVGLQFKNALIADRFFYDFGGQPGSFTPQQLQEVRKSSMARIYCDNSNVGTMQPEAFKSPALRGNSRVPCSSPAIPSLDLRVF